MQANSSSDSPHLQTLSREILWQRHVDQWRRSGLSKMAYCRQHALAYHQMVYWSKKEDHVAEPAIACGGFVAVTVASQARDCGLSVRLPNGLTIEGITDYRIELVGKLIAQL